VFEAAKVEVVTLTSALPDGSSACRMEGTTEVHYLAGTNPDKMDERFWRATAVSPDI